ncbi:MAG: hypothetical protein EXS37_20990 [Opitutus sp.]|nr:hypothetical protein [Opitutus sp.]
MDIASWPCLNPNMRFGLFALGSFLTGYSALFGQGASPPTVVSQPESITAYIGESATLSATIAGTPTPTLQWLRAGSPISGATNSTFTIASAALTDYSFYHLVATNASGSVTTQGAVITVTKRPQTISFTPSATVIAAGSGVVLTASSSVNLPVALTVLAGSATLSGILLTGSGGNVVVRASQAGTAAIAAADPVDRTITFVAGALSPFITSPPADQTVTAGTVTTLRTAAIGTPAPTYQWQKDGVPLPGATGATLTFANPTVADSARYTVTATNFLGTSTASATLTVRAAPVLTTVPASQTVPAGSTVNFSVAVTGFPVPTLQWRKNGAAIAGATSATLRFASAVAADAGRYDVVATNAVGTVTSAVATLTVTTRDLTGTFFGQFAAGSGGTTGAGEFTLLVRANRTAVFLGHLPGLSAGIAVLDLTLDPSGNFSGGVTAGTRSATLRGVVDDAAGVIVGTLAELNVTLRGDRAPRTGTASAQAGFYQAALVGSAASLGYIIVAADGRAFVLTGNGAIVDSASGRIGTNGRLTLTTTTQAAIDLGFNNGALSGTVRVGNVTSTLSGANEALLGSEHLVNLSVRSTTLTAAPLITGFVVSGTTPKQVLIRTAGPSLVQAPFNVAGALPDPTLQVFRGSNVVAQNDNWGAPATNVPAITAASTRAGAFPFLNNSNDAALVVSLPPGPYTVVVGGGNGIVLAEVYEVLETGEAPGTRRLVNLSARGVVAPGAPLIAGFVITGSSPQRVLIRGIGPTLGAPPFGVAGALPNPQLTLFRGANAVKTNDDWFRDADAALIRDAAARAGAFALGPQSADASILIFLEPGAYTAQVSGPANADAANSTGIALVEVYESVP